MMLEIVISDILQERGVSQSKAQTSCKILEWIGILTTSMLLFRALTSLCSGEFNTSCKIPGASSGLFPIPIA